MHWTVCDGKSPPGESEIIKQKKKKKMKGPPLPSQKRMTCTSDKEVLFTAAANSRREKVAFTLIHTSKMPSLTTVCVPHASRAGGVQVKVAEKGNALRPSCFQPSGGEPSKS